MAQKKNVNAEFCIWKVLTEKRITKNLEKAAREYAKTEYDLDLTHNRFSDGMKNLKQANLVIFEQSDYSSKVFQVNPKASPSVIQILEMIGEEFRVIKRIRKETEGFEVTMKDFEAGSVETLKMTQMFVTNRKKMLLARIKWYTLIQQEGECPKFLEDEITVQKEAAEKLLKRIHSALKKLDPRLATLSSVSLWKDSEKEIAEIVDEHAKIIKEYERREQEALKKLKDKSIN